MIYGFYHIATMNDWETIVDKQLTKLLNSELFAKTDKLFIHILGSDKDVLYVKSLVNNDKVEINYSSSFDEFEFPILKKLQSMSREKDFLCYYLHTKGVSITEKNKTWYHNSTNYEHLKNCVEDWREYMEYFLIDKYDLCIESLNNRDAVGVQYTKEHHCFSGNFWWSKSDYINKLTDLNLIDKSHRWNAEFWVGSGKGKLHGLFKNNAGYLERLNKEDYMI